MRLLIVEDEVLLVAQVDKFLRENDFVVDMATDGEEGLYYAREYDYDAAVIDLGLPKLTGIELIRTLRREGNTVPVLILTARSDWRDKVGGLEAGADDYLTKPFHMEELLARLKVLIRRAAGFCLVGHRTRPAETRYVEQGGAHRRCIGGTHRLRIPPAGIPGVESFPRRVQG